MLSQITALTEYAASNLTWPRITSGEWASFALLMVFVVLTAIERHKPDRKWPQHRQKQSRRTNIGFLMLNSSLLSLLSASSLYLVAEQNAYQGLLGRLSNPWLKACVSFLLLDLIFYLWHKASHSFDGLWLFHRVHHNDPYLNVSTAFRIHLVELLVATGLKAAYIIALGVEPALVFAYEALMMTFVMFHHTNISFAGEKWLGKLFIVPYLHRVHHSTLRVEHDSNYGAVLSVWDRLFGTLIEIDPVSIGIKGRSPQTVLELVKFGFTGSVQPEFNEPAACFDIRSMIAEAAYYKAEKRGFYPGYELGDWFAAETEIIEQVYQAPVLSSPVKKPVKKPFGQALLDFFRPGLTCNSAVVESMAARSI
ncbi:MAG: fatty acid hydroxylase [Gammaproteobacteria bacterium HGW-Gammaproteobacteria-10]|nr:MAG: fatty acid hydroxylase [Gammaproteobacteria bacterium HGW-Gammaproteobacteria-3]PKM35636.1 MAG: fatty acid hydroxylase [Gammaproteobacteria bacterium HGW-Gammaproteobacteria-10]